MSIADTILAQDDRAPVAVDAWGQRLFIVPMSGRERDSYDRELYDARKAAADSEDRHNWRSRFLVRCLYAPNPDPAGAGKLVRVFRNDQADALGEKHHATIERLFKIASTVNESGPDAVADAAKNS